MKGKLPQSRLRLLALSAALALIVSLLPSQAALTLAATGDLVGTVTFSQDCESGIGVGIAFDGANLWYSCYASQTDLYRADPVTGQVSASYSIVGGLGALAYDASRNALWAGWGGVNDGDVQLIQLDAAKNVVSSASVFNAAHVDGLDDGLAFDGLDDTLYVSEDGSTTIQHYTTAGVPLGEFAWAGNDCYNSGLAIGGQLLYEGSDGCNHVWVVDKANTSTVAFDFDTFLAGDPNARDEDLECDTVTFAAQGKHVMWSKEAYSPARASAFEIPFGSCGVGGQPAVTEVSIDIKPGSFPNSIKLSNAGVVPVAILTTDDFDATSVDPSTVCFGDAEDTAQRDCSEAHGRGHLEDVNGDGRLDLVLHYETGQTGIDKGDTQACLTGQTYDGAQIEGCDSVRTL